MPLLPAVQPARVLQLASLGTELYGAGPHHWVQQGLWAHPASGDQKV